MKWVARRRKSNRQACHQGNSSQKGSVRVCAWSLSLCEMKHHKHTHMTWAWEKFSVWEKNSPTHIHSFFACVWHSVWKNITQTHILSLCVWEFSVGEKIHPHTFTPCVCVCVCVCVTLVREENHSHTHKHILSLCVCGNSLCEKKFTQHIYSLFVCVCNSRAREYHHTQTYSLSVCATLCVREYHTHLSRVVEKRNLVPCSHWGGASCFRDSSCNVDHSQWKFTPTTDHLGESRDHLGESRTTSENLGPPRTKQPTRLPWTISDTEITMDCLKT